MGTVIQVPCSKWVPSECVKHFSSFLIETDYIKNYEHNLRETIVMCLWR